MNKLSALALFALAITCVQCVPSVKVDSPWFVETSAGTSGAVGAAVEEIPKFFDTRSEWYGCGITVLDQGHCGSCWAVSAAMNLGDRFCIHMAENNASIPNTGKGGSGTLSRMFQKAGRCIGPGDATRNHGCKRALEYVSPQALVSCGTITESDDYSKSGGCNGGESYDAMRFFHNTGLTTMTADEAGMWTGPTGGCTPYTSGRVVGKDPHSNGCRSCASATETCMDTGLPPRFFKMSEWGWIKHSLSKRKLTGEPRDASEQAELDRLVRAIQVEVMTNGPVHFNIDDYENFVPFFDDYPLGIYNSTVKGPKVGGHCMNIIGWGEDKASGLPYWLFKNSWGAKWGTEGVGRYVRGTDIGGIESFVYAGCPADTDCKLTAGVDTNIMHDFDAAHERMSSGNWIQAEVHQPLVVEAVKTAVPVWAERFGNQTAIDESGLPAATVVRAWTRSAGGAQVKMTVQLIEQSEKQTMNYFEAVVARVPNAAGMEVLEMDGSVGPEP